MTAEGSTPAHKPIRRIAVLAGGWSGERDISMASGRCVLKELQASGKYEVCLIDVHRDLLRLAQDIKAADPDLLFVETHGVGGEDGALQGALEFTGIPYTHSGVAASAVAMHKVFSRVLFERVGISTPEWKVLSAEDLLHGVRPFPFPFVIKPINQGSSLGVYILSSEEEVQTALREWTYGPVLVEEYIQGRELTCAVLQGKPSSVIEIKPHGRFFDFKVKYTPGGADHIVPAPVPSKVYQQVLDYSVKAYEALECRGVVRVDFLYGSNEKLYLLELNNIPGMTDVSLVVDSGFSYTEIVEGLIADAVTPHG